MPTSEARVATDRAGRYLQHLCKHLSHQGRHLGHRPGAHQDGPGAAHPAMRATVEWSDAEGRIEFEHGHLHLGAGPDALVLRADAEDLDTLRHIENLISGHLARFSRRSPLTVHWQPDEAADVAEAGAG